MCCAAGCGACVACGDGVCVQGENCAGCPADCGACDGDVEREDPGEELGPGDAPGCDGPG